MKFLVIFIAVIITTYALSIPDSIEEKWKNFKITHQRQYKSLSEEAKRFKIFTENLDKIENHNKLYEQGLSSYKMGINKFTDMSQDEFTKILNTKPKTKLSIHNASIMNTELHEDDLPDSFDWREKNAVGPVKDQKSCGSWVFPTVGALETYFYNRTGELRQFSEQELIDCDSTNHGCESGEPTLAYIYMMMVGLSSSEDYPFTGEAGTCSKTTPNNASELSIHGFLRGDYTENEDGLKWNVVNNGAFTAMINGNLLATYTSGIIDDETCTADDLNHDVLIVGYGVDENKIEYWTVKNSWGAEWGEDGYARIARNHNNMCGIATYVTTIF